MTASAEETGDDHVRDSDTSARNSETSASEVDKIHDDKLESLLDAIDGRTVRQQMLHDFMADGFMALARERYSNPASWERLGHGVYDKRADMKSSVLVQVVQCSEDGELQLSKYDTVEDGDVQGVANKLAETTLRKRGGKSKAPVESTATDLDGRKRSAGMEVRTSFAAIPSPEIREAIRYFRLAADQALELANATSKAEVLLKG